MLRSSEIEAITEWHWSMATIFEFICYHVHVARWLRKWPKWAIGQLRQLSRAPDMSGKVRSTWISDDIGTCPEKKVWNSVSGKYRTSLHLITGPGPKSEPAGKSESRGPENGVSRWRRQNSDIYSQNHHFGIVYDMIYQVLGMEAKNYKFGMFCQQCHLSVASGDADIRPRNASRIHTCHLFTS